MIRVKRL